MARRAVGTAFRALWLVIWIAAIIVALRFLVGSIIERDWSAVPVLLVWLGGAGFALWRVGLAFAERVSGERLGPERRRRARHSWQDDVVEPGGRSRD